MSFQIKKFSSIITSMINWVSSNTSKVTDFNPGSVVRTVLEAVAMELEELYYQLLQATQEAIEEAIYRTFNFPRNPSQKAGGTIRFYRLTGTEVVVTVPLDTMVGTDTEPPLTYLTTSEEIIPYLTGTAMGGELVLKSAGYVNCVAGDIGKQVKDDGANVGLLMAYDNTLRKWWINTYSVIVTSSVMTIAAGTGAGSSQSLTLSSTTTLIDYAKDFITEGIITGSIVKKWNGTLPYGDATVLIVALHTLTFASVLTNGATFAGGGDSYKVIVPYVDISVQAGVAGIGSNVSANSITVLKTNVPNVMSCTNLLAFTNGLDEESDMSRKTRFSTYIQSLARATRSALEYAAKTVDTITDAKAIDDVRPTVLTYNFSTTTYTDITDAMRNPSDAAVVLFPADQGIGDLLLIGGTELFEYLNMHLTATYVVAGTNPVIEYFSDTPAPNEWKTLSCTDGTAFLTGSGTISWTIPTDWIATTINSMLRLWIRIRLVNAGTYTPTVPQGEYCSLPPGFGYVFLYCHDGSGDLGTALKTSVEDVVEVYKGCGIIVVVKVPTKITPTITLQIVVAANYDASEMADLVKQAIVDHLNAKKLGEDLYLAELFQLVMGYNDKAIINVDITAPTVDEIVPSSAVLRANTSLITVTYIQW